MGMITSSIDELTIKTHIGQIMFTIWLDHAFFDHTPQQTTEKHNHAVFEFHYITKGVGIIYAGDKKYEAAPGSYYIVKEGMYHMQKRASFDNIKRHSFKFRFDIDNDLSGICPEDEIKSFVYALSNIKFFLSNNLGSIMHIISDIQTELKNKTNGFYTKAQYLFSLLFINMIREIAYESKIDERPANELHQRDRMRIIEKFFESNINQKVTLKELCALVNLSKSQLNRILREKYDMSFKQKHIEVQIEHIKDMLINTNMSINEISDQMGYTSVSNFTAFFKHKAGLTPKAFKKSVNDN